MPHITLTSAGDADDDSEEDPIFHFHSHHVSQRDPTRPDRRHPLAPQHTFRGKARRPQY